MGHGRDGTAAGRPQPAETVEVAPGDELDRSPRGRRRRGPIAVALVALVAVVGVATAIVLTGPDDAGRRARKESLKTPAAQQVFAALGTTTAAGSFTATYEVETIPARQAPTRTRCPDLEPMTRADGSQHASVGCLEVVGPGSSGPVTITGVATINKDPYRMRSVSNVTGFGQITTLVDSTRLWEDGGGNYGMTSPSGKDAPGAPMSGFASLVEGTLGRGPGALTMLTLASPNGYLNLSKAAVTGVTPAGSGTVDGIPVTYFDVVVRPGQLLDDPGLSGEQVKTIRDALAVLEETGHQDNTTRVGIDAAGLIRETSSTATFADGTRQRNRTTFSDFGCAGIVELPGDPPSTAAATPCPAPTTATTVATEPPSPPTTVVSGGTPAITDAPSSTSTTAVSAGSSTTSTSTTTTTRPGAGG